ncbi:MAG: dihydropteroate synthase family protein [Treponema sp.]|nr:dihydropteroate synthase family protein [Treponema sp.]
MKILAQQPKPILCGIVNVTPDSFSDGGNWNSMDKAVSHALNLVEMGAGMLDIGGESTRPGSKFVPVSEEIKRIVPVVQELKKRTKIPISIDTWKSEVAKATLDVGADIINDITGFAGDSNMAKVVAQAKRDVVLMFNPVIYRPEHESCKIFPQFNLNKSNENFLMETEKKLMQKMNIIDAMKFYLERSVKIAREVGIPDEKIMLDPGIGFGLTKKENAILIKHIDILHEMGFEIFLGVSRKRFLINILAESGVNINVESEEGFKNRDFASAILTGIATEKNVKVVRVHSISEHKIARDVMNAILYAEEKKDAHFSAYSSKKN